MNIVVLTKCLCQRASSLVVCEPKIVWTFTVLKRWIGIPFRALGIKQTSGFSSSKNTVLKT